MVGGIKSECPGGLRRNLHLLWFGGQSATYTYEKVLDYLLQSPQLVILSDQDKQQIAQQVFALLSKQVAQDQVQNVYHALQSDAAVRGVGAHQGINERPQHIIPRSEFGARSNSHKETEEQVKTRTKNVVTTVTLISPVLLDASPRRWRVRGASGEFGVSVKDEGFLKSVISGEIKVDMVANIRLEVVLQSKEILKDGVWTIRERDILKVLKVTIPKQGTLDLSGTSS
jgi:hypothetical protein